MSNASQFEVRSKAFRVAIVAFMTALVLLTVPEHRSSVISFLGQTFTHQQERLTELAIADPAAVPSLYSPSSPIQTDFLIRNHEGREVKYFYRVSVGTLSSTVKDITIADGKAVRVAVALPVADYGQRTKVTVELMGRSEALHFWLERDNG